MIYRGFPERLHHRVPHWVEPGAVFHIRIRLEREKEQRALTDPALAKAILDSAKFYEARMRWHITLFLLMPDHWHAVLSFARAESMSGHQSMEAFSYAQQRSPVAGAGSHIWCVSRWLRQPSRRRQCRVGAVHLARLERERTATLVSSTALSGSRLLRCRPTAWRRAHPARCRALHPPGILATP